MFRFVVLLAFGVASVLAIKEECLKLGRPHTRHCCKTPVPRLPRGEIMKECFKEFGKSAKTNCEVDVCIGKKMGYIADDGTIDKNALEETVTENLKEIPEVLVNVKKNCINADVAEYGPEGLCELRKISRCIHIEYMKSCPEFDNKEQCSGIKELAEKCAAA